MRGAAWLLVGLGLASCEPEICEEAAPIPIEATRYYSDGPDEIFGATETAVLWGFLDNEFRLFYIDEQGRSVEVIYQGTPPRRPLNRVPVTPL